MDGTSDGQIDGLAGILCGRVRGCARAGVGVTGSMPLTPNRPALRSSKNNGHLQVIYWSNADEIRIIYWSNADEILVES